MSVVNVKVQFIRKEGYGNLKAWMEDPQNIYVGRGRVVFLTKEGPSFPPKDSPFCNPFKVGKDGTREDVIAKFRSSMEAKLQGDPDLVQQLLALEGKRLGCWCKPEACHGDVLLELIQKYKQSV
jgi:hypothetical protein